MSQVAPNKLVSFAPELIRVSIHELHSTSHFATEHMKFAGLVRRVQRILEMSGEEQ